MSTLELKELSHPSGEVIKIASGKTLDLNSQGTTKMPAGSVIQVKKFQSASTGSGTSTVTSMADDGVQVAITPKYANSLLFVSCTSGCSVSGGYAYFRILENVSSTVVQAAPWGNFSGSPQQLGSFTITGWSSPPDTSTRTFKLQGYTTAGTRYLNYSVYPNITVMEIAQ